MTKSTSIYDLDGKPELKVAIPLGLQHVLAMFAGNIAPIMIIAGVVGLSIEDKVFMIQCAMFVAGLVTLIQLYPVGRVGARLPIVMGTSFAFVPTAIAVGESYGLPAVLGGSLIGSLAEIIMGFFVKPLRKYFPPIVTGIVLVTIGFSLFPVGINYFAGGAGAADFGSPKNLFLGFFVLIIIILLQRFSKGLLNVASILIGIILGYIVAIPLKKVDFSGVSTAGWISIPRPLKFGMEFRLDAILKFASVYLVVGLETLGNVSGITLSGLNREANEDEMSGAVIADGVGSAIGAFFNVLPNTAFGQNAGIVAMTKVMSRYCVATGAIFLMLAGIVPKFGAICAAMPSSVLGGAVMMVFSMITISGFKMISLAGFDDRNTIILAISLSLGLGFAQVPAATEYMPVVMKSFFGDSVVAAGLLALFLNAIIPQKEETEEETQAE
ncbi:uracil-xanthine permease family protein [Anaerosalibacter massiliensis]|mgnify:CR=1 FL=1|uniref:Purine permease n=1 Tax=Anaerosalibacter massiliensis TaxID=1347392 RepID=A0A9X2MDH2_9FIRM|nr:nucleobase:cation symporter-2 family protein [Anaerosalibacter massiliensis]MCR2042982.1 purine permease [Anaerosalibacter massiliensis]